MWFWPKWRTWVKVVLTVLVAFYAIIWLILMVLILSSAVNPQAQIDKAQCVTACQEVEVEDVNACATECFEEIYGIQEEPIPEFK